MLIVNVSVFEIVLGVKLFIVIEIIMGSLAVAVSQFSASVN